MTAGRIIMYVIAAALAGVTVGLLRAAPPHQRDLSQHDLAQPQSVVVTDISVKSPPPSSSPPSSSPPPSSAAARPLAAEPDAARSGPELPPGGPVPQQGEGWWRTVAGTSAQIGTGQVRTYSVEVEQGVVPSQVHQAFADVVEKTLADPRGWTAGGGIAFRRVDVAVPDVRIRLTTTETARGVCGFDVPYDTSCYVKGVVYVNAARWFRGARSFAGDLAGYRRYVVNHEIGHFLGRGHEPCQADGAPAPVMMQQTFGLANNELADLTATAPQGLAVPRDGKVCAPNPWPNPGVAR
jgi:hypothetical protein